MATLTENDTQSRVNQELLEAAQEASQSDADEASRIEQFLRTGEDTDPDLSRQSWSERTEYHRKHRERRNSALRSLFLRLSSFLPDEARAIPGVTREEVRRRVSPMIEGLIKPTEWREVALREIGNRLFVLTHADTPAAIDAEISTSWDRHAWEVFWMYFKDWGLALDGLDLEMDGVSAGRFAHVRPSTLKRKDPYCDVIIHEAAHLLHYMKPSEFGLPIKRGQERFVDVEYRHRELFAYACEAYTKVAARGSRKERVVFAGRMPVEATSFAKSLLPETAGLVLAAAHSRNGWKVIREAVVIKRKTHRQFMAEILAEKRPKSAPNSFLS